MVFMTYIERGIFKNVGPIEMISPYLWAYISLLLIVFNSYVV